MSYAKFLMKHDNLTPAEAQRELDLIYIDNAGRLVDDNTRQIMGGYSTHYMKLKEQRGVNA
jgi:hypothetical protein